MTIYPDWDAGAIDPPDEKELEDCRKCDNTGEVCGWCLVRLRECKCPVIEPGELACGPLTQGDVLGYAEEHAARAIDCIDCEGAHKP